MQEEAKSLDVEESAEQIAQSRKKQQIRLSQQPANLLSKEGFALYVGKSERAVAEMAKEGKLPAFYMADPLNGQRAELWISRAEWDKYHDQLVDKAPDEWHSWKDRLSADKPKKARRKTQQHAA
ncbi:Cox family DNA-binding protein [Trabulsiella odontotermitis]|uniref:Regulatory protein n=1 Tax=Trabulsiella odontotermitis TaxID=379893 RepID=A0A0L0H3J1_9ENTR|nr:Cox family DNA-binding protein [Trabulsiella odontotermitis]KNC95762.1 regulatory protein [Trabulsiella odontotermitis]